MSLHRTVHEGPGPTVALLHGFTQTEASWRPVVDALVPHRRVVTVDLPGHGASSSVRADLAGAATLVANSIGDEPAVVVGYSMGGRIALRMALDHPGSVAELVLIGATAGIDEPHARAARLDADAVLADRLAHGDLDAFLAEWVAQPLFAGLQLRPDDLAARRANHGTDLAAAVRTLGTATMDPPWWAELEALAMPVRVVWGERDAKFAALGRRLAAGIGSNATTSEVPGVGHAAHLEDSAAVVAAITR